MNLNSLKVLKNVFHLSLGISDHSKNDISSILAVAMGATYFEKHITMDKNCTLHEMCHYHSHLSQRQASTCYLDLHLQLLILVFPFRNLSTFLNSIQFVSILIKIMKQMILIY